MCRVYATLGMALALGVTVYSQEPMRLGKGADFGPLAEQFDVVESEVSVIRGETSHSIVMKLKAKKDVDIADLAYAVGAFDKSKLLLQVVPLTFENAGFPLRKDEMTYAQCTIRLGVNSDESLPWHKLYVRAVKKPK